jgi:glyoxylase-like metal-dependent hydrolase (beta-lactamase superfamily II)
MPEHSPQIEHRGERMLTQVADGVWVRQSAWVWTNSIVVRGEDGLILVDPGIDGSELNQLADDLDRLGVPVVAGFCTHPHWDHLLGMPGSATCRATPPLPAPTLPVKPENGGRRWRRRARRVSLSS